MTINGSLAGLVAITAPCAFVSIESSVIIGLIAGIIVVPAVVMFDRLKIDDPVGALSVHLVNGVWGTLSVGLFATSTAPGGGADGLLNGGGFASLQAQVVGILAVIAFTLVLSLIAWFVIKQTMGLRVSAAEETQGLDLSEMGMEAYGNDPMGE
jgi:Amt family ammonium transporter